MSALTPWQSAALGPALAALAEGRLGHALLLVGPARLGKAAVAQVLAKRLFCGSPLTDGLACGRCRSCQLFDAGTHPDFRHETVEINEKTGKPRTGIVIEQVRGLGHWFALTPQLGGAQVAVISPADTMNEATSNALLKTLEEPAPGRFLLLVSDRPGRLPATIRSRCQRLLFRAPGREPALAWLVAQGHETAQAALALDAARDHPGLADDWLRTGGMALRTRVASELVALAQGRQAPLALAQGWLGDELGELRLRFAADIAQSVLAREVGAGADAEPLRLTLSADFTKLWAWYDAVNRVRAQLDAPLRHELLLAGLLVEWRNLFSDPSGKPGVGASRQGARQ